MRRCRFCHAVIEGRGVEVVYEHAVQCEGAIQSYMESGGDVELVEQCEAGSVVEVVEEKPQRQKDEDGE